MLVHHTAWSSVEFGAKILTSGQCFTVTSLATFLAPTPPRAGIGNLNCWLPNEPVSWNVYLPFWIGGYIYLVAVSRRYGKYAIFIFCVSKWERKLPLG